MISLYYDIDTILAEEELIPVSNLLDFQYLSNLDRDYNQQPMTVTHMKSPNNYDRIGESAPNEIRKERLSKITFYPKELIY